MKLNDFFEKYGSKLNPLESAFINNIFYKDLGEYGLDLIVPQVKIEREDGSGRLFYIDFVITTKLQKYAIETHGFNYHAPSKVPKERFDELTEKDNLLRSKFGKCYITLTREQVMTKPDDAIYEMRKHFKSDEELFNIFLNRNSKDIKPYEVQVDVLDKLTTTRASGNNSGLVVLATGLGKTFLSGFDVINSGSTRVLFIAHVVEILRKTRNDFEILMKNRVGDMTTFSSQNYDKSKSIVFSTIQAIHKKNSLEIFNKTYFDYIIIDEAHHVAASSYQSVIKYFTPKFLLGLTATPYRFDQKDIMQSFSDNLVFQMDQDEAIRKGYLANLVYKGFIDDIDYTDIRWNGTKYDIDDLNKLLMIEPRDKEIIAKYKQESLNKKTIGFCTSIEHAEYMSALFNKNGIKSEAIHSKIESSKSLLDIKDRNKLLESFRGNQFQVAFTVNMFNEGVDFPDVETILMLRPTESLTIFVQQIGRGLRISHKKESVKVLDFIGNYKTAPIILDGLKIKLTDLEFDKEKLIYFYDNKGTKVEFDEEVVEVFKFISAKQTKEVSIEKISNEWQSYGEYIGKCSSTDEHNHNSKNHFWSVDKKKRNIDQHIDAIDFIFKNLKEFPNSLDMNKALVALSKKENRSFEGLRALFFSKLLGLITNEKFPFKRTEVFKKIIIDRSVQQNVINNQMEKLFFWNDIYSKINRHSSHTITDKNEIFKIYTIFFIYQIFEKLNAIGENLILTKFELQYFVFFARSHDELNDIFEKIVAYRNYSEKYELEKFLASKTKTDRSIERFQIYDTRYYSILQFIAAFSFNKDRITLKENYQEEVFGKVAKFENLLKNKDIIPFKNYDDYKDMLYSNKTLLEYYGS